MKHARPHLTTVLTTEKRVENMMQSEVFLTNFDDTVYIFSIKTKTKDKTEKQNRKNLCLLRSDIQTSSQS